MTIGSNIKELRTKKGMTQKELADALYVTSQAVSRWENNDVEPSIDTLNSMTAVLDCTLDELFGKEPKEPEKIIEEKVVVQEKVVVKEGEPILAICEWCNKPIYKAEDVCRSESVQKIVNGRTHTNQVVKLVLCPDCENKRIKEEKEKEEKAKKAKILEFRKQRIHSFIWGPLAALLVVILAIYAFCINEVQVGIFLAVISVCTFTFVSSAILDNTFIGGMWVDIASWGFVRMPGVIMEFSWDGIIRGIILKFTLWLLAELLGLITTILATAIALPLSLFVYPFAIVRNVKCVEY